MSARVQKGSTVFKPLAKTRPRPAPRQTSAAPTENAISAPSSSSGDSRTTPAPAPDVAARLSMPPPPTIPQRGPRPAEIVPSDTPPRVIPSFASPMYRSQSPHAVRPNPTVPSSQAPIALSRPTPSTSNLSIASTSRVPPAAQQIDVSYPTISSAHPPTELALPGSPFIVWPINMLDPSPTDQSTTTYAPRLALNNADSTVKARTSRNTGGAGMPVASGVVSTSDDAQSGPQVNGQRSVGVGQHLGAAADSSQGAAPRKRRATRKAASADHSETGTEGAGPSFTRQKRKSASRESRPVRRRREPSVPPFYPTADPGEELDPTAITMGQLCKDTGQGRVSTRVVQIQSNHAAWKASNREKRARMKGVMELRKYGRAEGEGGTGERAPGSENSQNPIASGSGAASGEPAPSGASDAGHAAEDATGHGFDYSQPLSTSRFNVQVRIGPNGETIIDEESLYVDRDNEEHMEDYTHVEESDTSKFVNSATYGKKYRGSRWSAEETELFFDALSQFGENYELISYVLPGRDRTACKNKFKAEDRKNPNRINYCLNNRTPYDMQTLSRLTGKDFTGPTPEIRARPPLTLHENPAESGGLSAADLRKTSQTPGVELDRADAEAVVRDAEGERVG